MNRETPRQQNQRERLRQRLREIKPEDHDMIELVGVLKGLLDIIDDMAAGRVAKHTPSGSRLVFGGRGDE